MGQNSKPVARETERDPLQMQSYATGAPVVTPARSLGPHLLLSRARFLSLSLSSLLPLVIPFLDRCFFVSSRLSLAQLRFSQQQQQQLGRFLSRFCVPSGLHLESFSIWSK
jgi:hypothetical protein